MKTLHSLSLIALTSIVAACSADQASAPAVTHVDVAQSSLQRDEAPIVADADKTQLTSDNAVFAVALHKELVAAAPNDNLVYSPHSISTALAMAYAGARNTSADEMEKTLHYGLGQAKLHPALDWLDLQISSRGKNATGQDGKPFRLNVVNSVWGDKATGFETPYLDTLAVSYGAGLNLLDFRADPNGARSTINGWTSDRTEKKIPELLAEGTITSDTRMVLVNAVYFNASWATKFTKEATSPQSFTHLDGSKANVDMMAQASSFAYGEGDGYKAVALPYDGNELSMIVVLPDSLPAFESSLTGDKLATIAASLKMDRVNLSLPKLKLDSGTSLATTLKAMGMKTPFDQDHADFTGISKTTPLYISDVIHKAICNVDEDGTEAAAATAVIIGETTSVQVDPPKTFTANHPFFFTIVDNATHAIIFAGRVADPAK